MKDSKNDRAQRFANIHAQTRETAKRSQEWMAAELGVSKKTVQNWEKGVSSPSFFQSLEWFRVLNLNPFPYYLSIIHPDKLHPVEPDSSDEKIEEAFNTLIQDISIRDKRALLYLYYGKHGSNPYSVIQLMLAHLHLPIKERLADATSVMHRYEVEKQMGTLICPDNIKPDEENLKNAIRKAQESTLKREFGYTSIDKE